MPPNIYGHAFGWFDGSPASIHPTPPRTRSVRIVEGFGGIDTALAKARAAFDQNDLSWAAELAEHCRTVEDRAQTRLLLAAIYRALAHRSRGSIGRHFYLTAALSLQGAITVPDAYHPSPASVLRSPPETYINQFRIRLDPRRSRGVDRYLVVHLTDVGRDYGLHVRNSVCHVITEPVAERSATVPGRPDATLNLSFQEWAALYCGGTTVAELNQSASDRGGPADVLVDFFNMFDAPPRPRARARATKLDTNLRG